MSRPEIFIASSTHSLPRAQAIARSLKDVADVLVWKDASMFPPGAETLTPLLERAFTTDFAVFLFTKDDEVTPIGKSQSGTLKSRDNVVFEFGLFLGALGKERIFTVLEHGITMPTDLKAMTVDAIFTAEPVMTDKTCATELKNACAKIKKRLKGLFPSRTSEFCRESSRRLRVTLRNLNSVVYNQVLKTGEQFRVDLADRLVEETRTELSQALSAERYVSEITLEKSFLNRARHIFSKADSVVATSVDRYSRFWLPDDKPGKELVENYINIQPARTLRLFVFTHPRSAAFHRQVLSNHYDKYGETGGVFLCTLANYLDLLKRIPGVVSSERLPKEDFAFLEHRNSREEVILYQARLSQNTLEFGPLKNRDDPATRVREALEKMGELKPYEIDPDTRILRWGPAFQVDNGQWIGALEKLFQPDPAEEGAEDADILHLVFFKQNTNENEARLARAIANARRELALIYSSQLEQSLIRDIWFGRNTKLLRNLVAVDEVTGAEVRPHQNVTKRYPFCLCVRIDGRAAYQEYLGNKTHHEVRRDIQGTFGDAVIDRLLKSAGKKVFEELERNSRRFMIRAAYMRDEEIRSLVKLELSLKNQPAALRRALQY